MTLIILNDSFLHSNRPVFFNTGLSTYLSRGRRIRTASQPSCGTQNLLLLRSANFDRCANKRSLPLPLAAVACVARHARASGKINRHRKSDACCLAGAEGFEPSARGFGDRCSTN